MQEIINSLGENTILIIFGVITISELDCKSEINLSTFVQSNIVNIIINTIPNNVFTM